MECVVCFEDDSALQFRACCQHVICQSCIDDIVSTPGGTCLCQQRLTLVSWGSHPVYVQELGANLEEQVHAADAWFWSTQHREFVDMPSWEEYLNACIKSLVDYVKFLDRIHYYQIHGKYPPVQPWIFEPPGVMYRAQVYLHETYNQLVEEGLRRVEEMDWFNMRELESLKVQTPAICKIACQKHDGNVQFVLEPTYEFYKEIFHQNIYPALLCAAGSGHLEVLECLLNDHPDLRKRCNGVLQLASTNGKLAVVKHLLEHGKKVFIQTDQALDLAARYGHAEVVKCLLKYGANVKDDDRCVLGHAASNGHLEVVQCLLDHGANVHGNKDFALRYASINGHLDVVKCLLDHGADVHACNDEAFRLADDPEVIACLVKHGDTI